MGSIHNIVDYIPMDKLKHGYLYEILARNSNCGIWNSETNAFIIARTKFHDTYLFEEYHWDFNEYYGTVKPLKEIERYDGDYKNILEYLTYWKGKFYE